MGNCSHLSKVDWQHAHTYFTVVKVGMQKSVANKRDPARILIADHQWTVCRKMHRTISFCLMLLFKITLAFHTVPLIYDSVSHSQLSQSYSDKQVAPLLTVCRDLTACYCYLLSAVIWVNHFFSKASQSFNMLLILSVTSSLLQKVLVNNLPTYFLIP